MQDKISTTELNHNSFLSFDNKDPCDYTSPTLKIWDNFPTSTLLLLSMTESPVSQIGFEFGASNF